MIWKLRRRERRESRRWVDRHPPVVWEPHLDPRMRVAFSHDRLVEHGVVIARRIARREAGGNAQAPQHQGLRGGELFAVALLDVEEEPIHWVTSWRDMSELLRVLVV